MPQGDDISRLSSSIELAGLGWAISSVSEVRPSARGNNFWAELKSPTGEAVPVFIKQNLRDEDCFYRELAATLILDSIPSLSLTRPKLLFHIEDARLIAWDRLADHQTLGDFINQANLTDAQRALEKLSTSLATLNVASGGHEASCVCVLCERARYEANMVRDRRHVIEMLFGYDGVSAPANLDVTVNEIACIHESDRHRGLTHGDQAPSNVLCLEDKICLIDFEFAGFRPMLYDLATWNILCPLPSESVVKLTDQYRKTNSAIDIDFEKSWADACAFRALSMLTSFGERILETNGLWGRDWDKRSALIVAFRRAQAANSFPNRKTANYDLVASIADVVSRTWDMSPVNWHSLGMVDAVCA